MAIRKTPKKKKKKNKKTRPKKASVSRTIVKLGESKCAPGVCSPRRVQGLKTRVRKGAHTLITLKGPGVFLGGHVTKQGGATGLTFPKLDIDGKNVVNLSFAAARNMGLTEQNPYGLVLLRTGVLETMTMGFPTPLRFTKSLKLSVTVNETGIAQILANVVVGSA